MTVNVGGPPEACRWAAASVGARMTAMERDREVEMLIRMAATAADGSFTRKD